MTAKVYQNNKTVLLVDKSRAMLQMVAFTLAGAGYQTVEALDVQEALGQLRDRKFDLIISEVDLTRRDGISFLINVRDKDKNIPFLFLTNRSDPDTKDLAKNLGANGYLVKPFDPNTLIEIADSVTLPMSNRPGVLARLRKFLTGTLST